MPNGPVTVHGSVSTFQVETNTNTRTLCAQARGSQKLTPAGMSAVLTALGSYYAGLSAAQWAAASDFAAHVTAGSVTVYAAPGTESALAASLITAIGTKVQAG